MAPWPGEAAVTVNGSIAALTAPLVGIEATCAGVTAQLTAPISSGGIWHGGAPPQTVASLLNACAVNCAELAGEGAFCETQTAGLLGLGIIFTLSIRSWSVTRTVLLLLVWPLMVKLALILTGGTPGAPARGKE